MPWLICQQTPYSQIKFLSENSNISYIGYYKFLEKMLEYPVGRRQDFKLELDRFQLIKLDMDNGEWEVLKPLRKESYDFEELLKLNEVVVTNKDKIEVMKEKSKNFINSFTNNLKKIF